MVKSDTIRGSSLGRAELEAFLPADGTVLYAWVYGSHFRSPLTLSEMATRLRAAALPDCTGVEATPSEVVAAFRYKQWGLTIERFEDDFKLQVAFRSIGKRWGSNFALFRMLEARTLQAVEGERIAYLLDHATDTWG